MERIKKAIDLACLLQRLESFMEPVTILDMHKVFEIEREHYAYLKKRVEDFIPEIKKYIYKNYFDTALNQNEDYRYYVTDRTVYWQKTFHEEMRKLLLRLAESNDSYNPSQPSPADFLIDQFKKAILLYEEWKLVENSDEPANN
jgi:hypothetical protein